MKTKKAKPKPKTKSKPRRARVSGHSRQKSKTKAKLNKKKSGKGSRRLSRGKANTSGLPTFEQRGLGPRTGGQSGDTQGLPANPSFDSESVEELLEEGQSFEAGVLSGVENAPDPDQSEVVTKEVEEDDVPEEYRETN